MTTIEIKNVVKNFGKTAALRCVSATFASGKICGLLGRNGAGKTTLLNVITNRIFADQGQVWIDGEPALENDRAQGKIFYVTERTLYPEDQNAQELFKTTRLFYPQFDLAYAQSLSDRFGLDLRKKVGGLSTGYRSIFKLVLALASNAPVLLFDEPTLGLDANFRDLFYKELAVCYDRTGSTVVLSTHLIDEAAGLLEDVVVIHEGKILLASPLEALLAHAYTVSGSHENVDRYAQGKKVIREQVLGRYKAAVVFQDREQADQDALASLNLDITPARLQELVVSLTHE